MTREEAIIILNGFKSNPLFSDTHAQALDMAISALSENKGDLISRQAVDDVIYDYSRSCDVNYAQIMEYIDKIPSVENKGEWIKPVQDDGMSNPIYYQVRCSKCGFDIDPQTWYEELHCHGADNFCPNCGADMRGEE